MKNLKIFTDGGARGNPGPAAIGIVVVDKDSKKIFKKFGKKIGVTTNNVAEYTAVLETLKWLKENVKEKFAANFYLDSKLVVNQLNGYYKIKDAKLRELILEIKRGECEIGLNGAFFYNFVPREKNRIADSLVNFFLAEK